MKKVLALVLSLMTAGTAVKAESYGDNWKLPPLKLETIKDYERARRAKKIFAVSSLAGVVASGAVLFYAHKLDKKADRIIVNDPVLVVPPSGPSYYPIIQSQVDRKARLHSKASGARTAGAALGLISALCLTVAISIQF